MKIDGSINEILYISQHIGKSMSGRIQEAKGSLFFGFRSSFICTNSLFIVMLSVVIPYKMC